MNDKRIAEIYFFDGPMRGTYKYVHLSELYSNPTYRILIPLESTMQKIVGDQRNCTVQAYETHYIPLSIPSRYEEKRFVMIEKPFEKESSK
jgi:hypothetical protein